MRVKALIISVLCFTSICNASMHQQEKYVNKSIRVDPDEIIFRSEGMLLRKDAFNAIRITNLINENNEYWAFYKIDYVCGKCGAPYTKHPGACEVCGSTDIREREINLWPID